MKNLIFLNLLFISSCALYQDFRDTEFNWLGSGRPQKQQNVEKEEARIVEKKPSIAYEEAISKNWEYSKRKDQLTGVTTYEATTLTADKAATLSILKNDQDQLAIIVGLNKEHVSYREGHSVDVNLDGEWKVQQVEPSEGKVSKELKFSSSDELVRLFDGKRELTIEVLLNGKGTKKFLFDISGLQKFFTAI